MLVREMFPSARRGLVLGLRAFIVVVGMGAGGCHAKPGTLPVDSPVYAYRAPDNDDDDSDTTDPGDSAGSAGEAAGSGAKKE